MQTNEGNVQVNKVGNSEKCAVTTIKLDYASFIQRIYAYIIDMVVIFAISLLVFPIAYQITKNHLSHRQLLVIDTYIAQLITILYCAIMESSDKRATVGKKQSGIYVADLKGNRITFLKALTRNSIKFIATIAILIYNIFYTVDLSSGKAGIELLGYLFALFLPKRQALHDVIASTVVLSNLNNMKKQDN